MRYLGSKAKLLNMIEDVIEKYNIEEYTFGDLFAGTSCVGDYFKDRYKTLLLAEECFLQKIMGRKSMVLE